MRRPLSQARLVAIVAIVVACGNARVIQRTQPGGILELEGDHNKAMEQANEEMAAHCGPNNFTILQEGEEIVAVTDAAGAAPQPGGPPGARTSRNDRGDATATTPRPDRARTAMVWRVHYQCGTGGAPVAGQPPADSPPGELPPAPPAEPPSSR